MARHIRVPGIVDLVRVAAPAEIRALADEPRLDRRFTVRGPLVNRLIARRIQRWFQVDGRPLPSLAPRDDAARIERQRELAAALDPSTGRPLWTDEQVGRLAAFVRGETSRKEAGIAAQEVVGRLFDPNHVADRASWEAAELIDRFRDGFSPRQLVWMITGRLRRARALLLDRAGRDRHAVHGIAIGVHGIVDALERMRAIRAEPGSPGLAEDVVLGRCLAPPNRVPRVVEAPLATPATAARLRPGTMITFDLAAAGKHAPDPDMVFMRGRWSACPAEAFVTALLRAAWRRAL